MATLKLLDRVRLAAKVMVGVFSEQIGDEPLRMLQGIFPGAVGVPPRRGTQAYLRAYSEMPWLRAVAGRIADAVASVDWHLYVDRRPGQTKARRNKALQRAQLTERRAMMHKGLVTGDLRQIDEHPFYDLLESGNEFHTGLQVRKLIQLYLDLPGEAFLLKERNGAQAPVGLWPIPPHWVLGTPTPTNRFFRVGFKGWQGMIPETEILWIAEADPEDPYGRGRGIAWALADELETDEYAAKFQKAKFINQARPDFLIYPKGVQGMADPEVRRLEASWNDRLQGYQRAYKAHFANREVGIYEFDTQDFRSMQFVQLRQHERDIIVHTFGIPPELLGILENCLDAETECLTRRGWARQEDLRETDEIATWNEDLGRLEYHRPSRIARFDHDGPMHYWGGRVDFACTPEHRLWLRHGRRQGEREGWRFASSRECGTWTSARWRVTGGGFEGDQKTVTFPSWYHGLARRHLRPETPRWRPQPVEHPSVTLDVHLFAPFLGYWIAEGWLDPDGRPGASAVSYSQNRGLIADAMRQAMHGLGLGFVKERIRAGRHHEFTLRHRGLMDWLRRNAGDSARTKRIPGEVFEWPLAAQRMFFEALIDGDGSRGQGKTGATIRYGSASEGLIDDLQRLCVHLGLRAAKSKGGQGLAITEGSYQAIDRHGNSWLQERAYTGIVWCVEVENHRFFTRRGGRVVCHGNSNRSTIDSADYLFTSKVVVPRLEFLRGVYQERLIPEYDDRLIVDYANPVVDDKQLILEIGKAAPWSRMVDEWRAAQGLEPLDNDMGKVFMVPFQMGISADLAPKEAVAPTPFGGPPPGNGGGNGAPKAARKAVAGSADDLPALTLLASRLEPTLRRLFLAAVKQVKDRVSLEALAQAVLAGASLAEAALGVDGLPTALGDLRPALLQGFSLGVQVGGEALGRAGITIRLDLLNPHAATWAHAHAAALVTAVTDETRQAVRSLVGEAFTQGLSPQETARLLRDIVGLTERQAGAVNAFRLRLIADEVDEELVARRTARYAEAQLRLRADTIARTEIMTASNEGQHALWLEARSQGLLDEATRRVWLATHDDRLEPRCEALDETEATVTGDFAGGVKGPPLHPRCRCTTGLIVRR